ncbi:MAG: hypothetical protein JWQ34_3371 [Mucilaginibacter sp.]|uniref:hypothetical protein n=1 Tax=Mucilaginibacter sp. TaxID=1882438 RepID=UPI00260EC77C|nr:hypothetical protein [Mucilaginibacter sp.]MDB5005146.1 hypothetical protein [Mucilaginibacter sp.]
MNKAANTLLSATAGTTMMTLFSYLVSMAADKNFSEPEHLGTMIHRMMPGNSKRATQLAGWGAHYAVGWLFVLVYRELWKTGKIKKTVANGFILGALSGTLAVLVWKATLKAHPAPPWIDFTNYYIQLVPAHIVFAVCATLTSRLLDEGI